MFYIVSARETHIYTPDPMKAIKGAKGKILRILALDVGMVSSINQIDFIYNFIALYSELISMSKKKYNQIRCFVNRGVELKVVPWDYDFLQEADYDGLFIR